VTRLIGDDRINGAAGFDTDTGEFVLFDVDVVVLAAGGYTSLYQRHSSRDDENTGDGPALAYQAGAGLMDMEFVQFHPTGMVGDRYGEQWDGRLVTEAVRGEGGRLYNADVSASDASGGSGEPGSLGGERFMERYSPDQMELDARDIVARAIAEEIREGRGTENGGVYLDLSHRDAEFIQERLPRMYERFAELGVDMAEEPVEVAPTAHYGMGGVVVNETGETDVDGLFAIGETMAGVHGANRLGGNSLAETLAFGEVVGGAVAERLGEGTETDSELLRDRAGQHFSDLAALSGTDGSHDPEALFDELRETLWEHAGILRTDEELSTGLAELSSIRERASDLAVDEPTSRSFEFAMNLGFALDVAEAILRGGRRRTESRGSHARTDYPECNADWRQNLVVERDSLGTMSLRTTPVDEPSNAVQEALDAGYELDYHQLE
jgi:succinate dehydrogenase / fumarate reductase flavoprotein subunit